MLIIYSVSHIEHWPNLTYMIQSNCWSKNIRVFYRFFDSFLWIHYEKALQRQIFVTHRQYTGIIHPHDSSRACKRVNGCSINWECFFQITVYFSQFSWNGGALITLLRLCLHTLKWFHAGMVFAGISCFSFGVYTLFRNSSGISTIRYQKWNENAPEWFRHV